jgi:hypothetical protein
MVSKPVKAHRPQHPRVVLDKALDAKALSRLFNSVVRSAKTARPVMTYQGLQHHDEDFTDVLQLAFEEYATVVTSDGAFFDKVRQFQAERPRRQKNRCFNGVLLVSTVKALQISSLTSFLEGHLEVRCKGKPNGEIVTISDVAEFNIGVDLRAKSPRAIALCDCPWV